MRDYGDWYVDDGMYAAGASATTEPYAWDAYAAGDEIPDPELWAPGVPTSALVDMSMSDTNPQDETLARGLMEVLLQAVAYDSSGSVRAEAAAVDVSVVLRAIASGSRLPRSASGTIGTMAALDAMSRWAFTACGLEGLGGHGLVLAWLRSTVAHQFVHGPRAIGFVRDRLRAMLDTSAPWARADFDAAFGRSPEDMWAGVVLSPPPPARRAPEHAGLYGIAAAGKVRRDEEVEARFTTGWRRPLGMGTVWRETEQLHGAMLLDAMRPGAATDAYESLHATDPGVSILSSPAGREWAALATASATCVVPALAWYGVERDGITCLARSIVGSRVAAFGLGPQEAVQCGIGLAERVLPAGCDRLADIRGSFPDA